MARKKQVQNSDSSGAFSLPIVDAPTTSGRNSAFEGNGFQAVVEDLYAEAAAELAEEAAPPAPPPSPAPRSPTRRSGGARKVRTGAVAKNA